ncbi:MAG: hypothetical protein WBF99_03405 [Xanthobacteraceae bacterium]
MARPPGIVDQIKQAARQVLEQRPEGIRYKDLATAIQAEIPDAKQNTVYGALNVISGDSDILRPSRGHWILTKYADEGLKSTPDPQPVVKDKEESLREESFYEPFAEWLQSVEQEVNGVHVVGGNTFKSKWATPDVIGTRKKQPSDPVSFPLELVSAEIKIDPSQSVTAFGQACAYRLFSHKVYIVMPSSIERVKDDLERLEALCSLFGMGLVLFDPSLPNPDFRKLVAARKVEPDIYYLNELAKRLQLNDPPIFNKLF